jgi:hypothetical protein
VKPRVKILKSDMMMLEDIGWKMILLTGWFGY